MKLIQNKYNFLEISIIINRNLKEKAIIEALMMHGVLILNYFISLQIIDFFFFFFFFFFCLKIIIIIITKKKIKLL